MKPKTKKWLIAGFGIVAVVIAISLFAASYFVKRFDPYIREQVIAYLSQRFDSEVELASLSIRMPRLSALKLWYSHGRGAFANVTGEGVTLRRKGPADAPPMLTMKEFSFDVDLATVFSPIKNIQPVTIHGMEVNIPPKGQRSGGSFKHWDPGVLIEQITITDFALTILPKNPQKRPLRFDIHQLHLESAGRDVAMKYEASLTNAKPPGEIQSEGSFGPWNADEPGDSPLEGHYVFDKADLGVFHGIAGILHSTGDFKGTLSSIDVHGETSVPNFRLTRAGHAVPLKTRFDVQVDGTNGNVILKPVIGTLGRTTFSTSGVIIKRESEKSRTISLDVTMNDGNLPDLLRLATNGAPFMEGRISMKSRIDIPPLSGKVSERLRLDGQFEINHGKFLKSTIQDQIDTLSRRAQGQPKNMAIDEVVSMLGGKFKLDDQIITFNPVSFSVPGSGVDLTGSYDLEKDRLDFHGTLRLEAKISQTMTGWKRWLLKPIDPFFSKDGAGTLVRIQVVGTRDEPHFGREHGGKDSEDSETKESKK